MVVIDSQIIALSFGLVNVFTLTNANGASVKLSSFGAGILEINVPDRNGKLDDVVLGYRNLEDYMHDGPCAGKTPGRYANRIGLGQFSIDGKQYQLATNNGPNALHGGPENFANKIWDAKIVENGVEFNLVSPDGDEHYPGTLTAKVTYTWNDDNELTINYDADTDAPTVVSLTNHAYFNLSGDCSGCVLDTKVKLYAEKYLPTNSTQVPNGEYADVAGTPMDFRTPKALGKDIKQDFPALKYGKGYDSSWVIDNWEKGKLSPAAEVMDEKSGRKLSIFTTQPAVQVYTGNWLKGSPISKCGKEYSDYDAVALECQGMPDAPNKPNFPSQLLRPGEHYHEVIIYKLSTF